MTTTPPPCGHLQDGSPVYTFEDIAAQFGVSVERVKQLLAQAEADGETGLTVDVGKVIPLGQ